MNLFPRLFRGRSDWIVLMLTVGISLTLLFSRSHPAVACIRGELGDLLSWTTAPFRLSSQVFTLWRDNRELRETAANLSWENSELRDAAFENSRLRAMLDFRGRTPLHMTAADVIGYIGPQIGGRIRIGAGADHDVATGCAVLTPRGLVGKVIETSNHSALVQTLIGNSFGVSAKIERNRLTGIMRWTSRDEWTLIGLPTGADVRRGDLVITSGAGSVFPGGLRIGVVSEVLDGRDLTGASCRVQPFVNFYALEEVFVVTDRSASEAVPESQPTDSGGSAP